MRTSKLHMHAVLVVVAFAIAMTGCPSKCENKSSKMSDADQLVGKDRETIISSLGEPDWEAVANTSIVGDDPEGVKRMKEETAKTELGYGEIVIVLNFFDVAIRIERLDE